MILTKNSIIPKVLSVIGKSDRPTFVWLIAFSMLVGLFEALGVLSVAPLIAIVGNPEITERNPFLRGVQDLSGLRETHHFLMLVGLAAFVTIAIAICARIASFALMTRFVRTQSVAMETRLFRAYLDRPYSEIVRHNTGVLAGNVQREVALVVDGVILNVTRIIANGAVALCLFVLLFIADPRAALITVGLLGTGYTVVFFAIRHRLERLGAEAREARHTGARILSEGFGALRTIKLMRLEDRYVERYEAPLRNASMKTARMEMIRELPRGVLELMAFGGMIMLIVAIFAGGDRVTALSTMGLYALAGVRLFPVLQKLYLALASLRSHAPALDAILADLAEPPERTQPASLPLDFNNAVTFREVEYRFADTVLPALSDVSLQIFKGDRIGLVGRSGAGKSTLLDLLVGLIQPTRGAIDIDGLPITKLNISRLQATVSYVPQAVFMADATIAENIAFGVDSRDVDNARVAAAAEAAMLADFVASLPHGLDTRVGERGSTISGGEAQRIGIARALYLHQDILVLDEATSALDAVTEARILESLFADRRRTIIISAHRVDALRMCDRIVLLQAGRISDAGSFDELAAKSPAFRSLMTGGRPASLSHRTGPRNSE